MADIDKEALDFEHKMNALIKLYLQFNRDAAVKIARIAEEHTKENFEKQGFVDSGLDPWTPRVGDTDPGRALLVDTGELKNSIQGKVVSKTKIVVSTDVEYAKYHNEGNPDKNLPQRQFIGQSKELQIKIKRAIKESFRTIIKNKLK